MAGKHLQRWGAAWILTLLFLSSWCAQALVQLGVQHETMPDFFSATLENWQSEWLQLLVQAVLVVGFAEKLFRKSTEQMDRIERKLDRLSTSPSSPRGGDSEPQA